MSSNRNESNAEEGEEEDAGKRPSDDEAGVDGGAGRVAVGSKFIES